MAQSPEAVLAIEKRIALNAGVQIQQYDALVIGGGPGGSCAATYLARDGARVLLLEKEHFPRFHIGESLLPYNLLIFEELGVLPALREAGFLRKFGAQFFLGNGSKGTKFVFREGKFNKVPEAIQVERSVFDDILLKHARRSGVEVREGWAADSFEIGADGVAIEATSDTGGKARLQAKFLIDASGRTNLTGNQQGQRVIHQKLKKMAIFGHFHGVKMDDGEKANDTIIVRLENKWFWLIPISKDKVSVGCVLDREELAQANVSPEELFQRIVQSSQPMRHHMEDAKLTGVIRTLSDFSYRNKTLFDRRLLRVGDAAGFMDPIFSAGVYLAMYSGRLAARMVRESLMAGDDGVTRFPAYEKRICGSMQFYWRMVECFYTTPFMEVFLEPRHRFNLPAAVNAVLAGELEGGWRMRWRLELFFLIVKLQARWPLLPRVSFD